MVEILIPKLDGEKAAKIAQSDKWGALSRLASIFAAGVTTLLLLPLVIWGFTTIQQSSKILVEHSGDIANVQKTVDQIQAQDGKDHDALTVMRTQVDSLIVQVQKLWERPQRNDKPPP